MMEGKWGWLHCQYPAMGRQESREKHGKQANIGSNIERVPLGINVVSDYVNEFLFIVLVR